MKSDTEGYDMDDSISSEIVVDERAMREIVGRRVGGCACVRGVVGLISSFLGDTIVIEQLLVLRLHSLRVWRDRGLR